MTTSTSDSDNLPAVPENGLTFDAEVVRVIDGDTVEVETRIRHRVRLLDCWCEEVRLGRHTDAEAKARGLVAKAYLQQLLDGCDNRVRVHIPGNGGHLSELTTLSRVVGRMWRRFPGHQTDAGDVSYLMVAAGHATAEKTDA